MSQHRAALGLEVCADEAVSLLQWVTPSLFQSVLHGGNIRLAVIGCIVWVRLLFCFLQVALLECEGLLWS